MSKKKHNIYSCPKCRCKKTESTGNMASYPDHYQKFNCKHCGWLVGVIDNSPHISCWKFQDRVIDF